MTDSSTSFNWKANVRSGTDVVFVAGDKTGAFASFMDYRWDKISDRY